MSYQEKYLQLKAATLYLAKLWKEQPGQSEDARTCQEHSRALAGLVELVEELEPGVPERIVLAAVHKARADGYQVDGRPARAAGHQVEEGDHGR